MRQAKETRKLIAANWYSISKTWKLIASKLNRFTVMYCFYGTVLKVSHSGPHPVNYVLPWAVSLRWTTFLYFYVKVCLRSILVTIRTVLVQLRSHIIWAPIYLVLQLLYFVYKILDIIVKNRWQYRRVPALRNTYIVVNRVWSVILQFLSVSLVGCAILSFCRYSA